MRQMRMNAMLLAASALGLASPALADVVIDMPPPPSSSRVVTTLPSAEYEGYEPPASVGQIALSRYANARYGPYDTYASPGLAGPYGGWYGYPYASYPPYAYSGYPYSWYPYYGYPYYGFRFVKFRRPHIHLHLGPKSRFKVTNVKGDV